VCLTRVVMKSRNELKMYRLEFTISLSMQNQAEDRPAVSLYYYSDVISLC
jgi:hypothetical protein